MKITEILASPSETHMEEKQASNTFGFISRLCACIIQRSKDREQYLLLLICHQGLICLLHQGISRVDFMEFTGLL